MQAIIQKKKTLQDIAVIELLFSTGIRISELCSLKASDVNLPDNTILIYGKGAKEQVIEAFDLPEDTGEIHLSGVVSRKKQLIPTFVISLQQ